MKEKINSHFNKNLLFLFIYITVIIIILFIAILILDFKINKLNEKLNPTSELIFNPDYDIGFAKTIVSIPINLTTGLDSTLLTAVILCNFNDDAFWQLEYDYSQESWAIQCIEEEN